MIEKKNILKLECTACGACVSVCNHKAITFIENDEGFNYPVIYKELCVNCGLCEKVCLELITESSSKSNVKDGYYGWHKDETVRLGSSSGGVFTGIADEVIKRGGVVFGAIYDGCSGNVMHVSTRDVDIGLLRKSKYVQSFCGDIFKKVYNELMSGYEVLFSGTPCQIAGLKSYLGKDYKNLITCDFLCHGVPAVKLLKDHLKYLRGKNRHQIKEIDFRPKVRGWSKYDLKIIFENGKVCIRHSENDAFFVAFLNNLSLRNCCYKCKYSDNNNQSDITIGDFWGYRKYNPGINDEKGLSLVVVNTEKGKSYLEAVKQLQLYSLDWMFVESVFKKKDNKLYDREKRNQFFSKYISVGWPGTIKHYKLEWGIYKRMKNFMRNAIKLTLKKI